MNLIETVKKDQGGNKMAFQELIEHEKNKLYRIAYLYVKNLSNISAIA